MRSVAASLRGLGAPIAGLVAVIVVFGLLSQENFLTGANAQTVAAQSVVVVLGAIGMTFVVVSGGIDLSVGSTIALSSVCAALVLQAGGGDAPAALAAIGAGVAVGAVNGALVARLGIAPFIATLATMTAARGAAKWMAHETTVYPPGEWQSWFMLKRPDPEWLMAAPGVWMAIVIAIVAAIILGRTLFGTWTYAVGSNEATARLCGIPVTRVKFSVYVISGLLAGIAGIVQMHRVGGGDPTTAIGKELEVVAAVVIGGASLTGGEGRILGSLIGALLMTTMATGCTFVDLSALSDRLHLSESWKERLIAFFGGSNLHNYLQEILVGIIIVAAAWADRSRRRRALGRSQ